MQKSAAYSAAVLAGANIACKVLGFLYKVPLANLIGGEGMGYFGFAHQIFVVFANSHPDISLMPINMNEEITKMYNHVKLSSN